MLDFHNINYEKKSSIGYVLINRPNSLNALNRATLDEVCRAMQDARADSAISGVIVTGGGDKAFVAGADIKEMASMSPIQAADFSRYGQYVFNLIEDLGKPVIAAVQGLALGGGCEFAMACTLRLATPSAKFGQPEVKLGVIPGFGGTQRLPRIVGKGRALRLILTGETIGAAEAYRIGLVDEVVESSQIIARAESILGTIDRNAPMAVRLSIDAVHRGLNASQDSGLAIESALFAVSASTADRAEGMSAFIEKRSAKFTGR
jgi:enoyl-CoA hydratase